MNNLAPKEKQAFVVEEYGHIVGKTGDRYQVETTTGRVEALRAVTCLIEPGVGDKVLVCLAEGEAAYVLAILDRPDQADFHMAVPGNLTVSSTKGSIRMKAKDTIALSSERSVEMSSACLNTTFHTAQLVFHKLLYMGHIFEATLSRIKTVSRVVEAISERFHQIAGTSYRTIKESEHLRTGTYHCIVDKLLSMRGKYTVLTAKTDVKINGKHIHMG